MKVIMDITGIHNKVIVSVPDDISTREGTLMAIKTVCMIKETDIDVEEVIREETS